MTFAAGSRLGPYEILGPLGAGGMGVHDARIAALCRQHGVAELWTADRDFSRLPGLKVRNPLVDSTP